MNECLEYDPQSGPYIIGLTGAMATGKSSVLARLVEKGAYAIDCDKVSICIISGTSLSGHLHEIDTLSVPIGIFVPLKVGHLIVQDTLI